MSKYRYQRQLHRFLNLLMKTVIPVLLAGLVFSSQIAYAGVPSEQWVVRYAGYGEDEAAAITIDDIGNVYVTGSATGASTDIMTIKYDSTGVTQWTALYGSPTNSEYAKAVCIDSQGYVYVLGERLSGPNIMSCYIVIKYDNYGNKQWDRLWSQDSNEYTAVAMTLDASENIYITGYCMGSGGLVDFVTLKYGPDGELLWATIYDSPGNKADYASAIALDSKGNIYISGTSFDTTGKSGYTLVEYDNTGEILWEQTYNHTTSSIDICGNIVIDDADNVYITGASKDTTADSQYVTVKYTERIKQWATAYGPAGYISPFIGNLPAQVAVDDSGSIYVGGNSAGNAGGYLTIKYDSDGNEVWVKTYSRPESSASYFSDITVNNTYGVCVTGYSTNDMSDWIIATVQYDSEGTPFCDFVYNGPGSGDDLPRDIKCDSSGATYIVGISQGISTSWDWVTIKYAENSPPVLNDIPNQAINEGDTLNIIISASDIDGDDLTFSASNLPQGAIFDSIAATFTWTPNYKQAGIYTNICIQVSDGTIVKSKDFNITVNNVSISADIIISPSQLKLDSNRQWITAYIELPSEVDPEIFSLETTSLSISGEKVYAMTDTKFDFVTDPHAYLTDIDHDKIPEHMVKFDWNCIKALLTSNSNIPVVISGEPFNWPDTPDFSGTCTIIVK